MTAASVKEAIDALRGTPFLLAIVILNALVIVSMALTLYYVANAIERRDALIRTCLERTT
jgi:hypothetical protein